MKCIYLCLHLGWKLQVSLLLAVCCHVTELGGRKKLCKNNIFLVSQVAKRPQMVVVFIANHSKNCSGALWSPHTSLCFLQCLLNEQTPRPRGRNLCHLRDVLRSLGLAVGAPGEASGRQTQDGVTS